MESKYEMLIERNFYQSPSMYLVTKVTVSGEFNRHKLDDAIREIERVHPIITYVVEEGDEGKVYFMKKEDVKVTIKYHEKKSQKDWLGIAREEELVPLEFDKEPPLRFLIIHGKEDFDIVILSHHLLGDGHSIQYLMQDLLEVYCNEANDLPVQETRFIRKIEDMPKESELPTEFIERLQSVNQEWSTMRRHFTREEYEKLFSDYHETHGLGLMVEAYDKQKYPKLISRCKEYGVTINSALVTAFLAALHKVSKEEQKVTVAVDLRDHLKFETNRCIANYSSAISPKLKYYEEDTFWCNVERIHKLLKAELSQPSKPFFLLQLFLQADGSIFDPLYYAANGTYQNAILMKVAELLGFGNREQGFDLSNLGLVNINPKMGNYEIKDYAFFANPTTVYDFTVGVATFNEQLNLSICYKENKITEEELRAYTREAISLLSS